MEKPELYKASYLSDSCELSGLQLSGGLIQQDPTLFLESAGSHIEVIISADSMHCESFLFPEAASTQLHVCAHGCCLPAVLYLESSYRLPSHSRADLTWLSSKVLCNAMPELYLL